MTLKEFTVISLLALLLVGGLVYGVDKSMDERCRYQMSLDNPTEVTKDVCQEIN